MEAYIGQIEIFAFGVTPRGWALCAGQTLPVDQYPALYALIGTIYGGDGINTFALPNLQGLVAVGQGADPHLSVRVLGQTGGEATHTLGTAETPWHTHALRTAATAQDAVNSPSGTVVLGAASGTQAGGSFPVPLYVSDPNPAQALAPQAVGAVGGQPHTNMMPSSALYYCIALEGQFPTQD